MTYNLVCEFKPYQRLPLFPCYFCCSFLFELNCETSNFCIWKSGSNLFLKSTSTWQWGLNFLLTEKKQESFDGVFDTWQASTGFKSDVLTTAPHHSLTMLLTHGQYQQFNQHWDGVDMKTAISLRVVTFNTVSDW